MNENYVNQDSQNESVTGTVMDNNADYKTYANNQPQVSDNSKGLAITSLILGIVSFFCCGPVSSIVGLVLGIMSRKKNSSDNGMATAGIVLSIIALVLWIAILIWSIVMTGSIMGLIENIMNDANVTYSYSY